MKSIIILSMISFLFASCSSSLPDNSHKFDVPLKLKIEELSNKSSNEKIGIFGKCESEITDAMRKIMEESGADIYTIINDTFTASGNSDQIYKLAANDFVTQLQLSTTSEMK